MLDAPKDYDYWRKFMNIRRDNITAEQMIEWLMRDFHFQEFIDPSKEEEFYLYLNSVILSFASYSRQFGVMCFKNGGKNAEINRLNVTGKRMLTQEKGRDYIEDIAASGPSSGDIEGFEESFIDKSGISAAKEFEEAYGKIGRRKVLPEMRGEL